MNDIKFNCPQCGQHLAVDATVAGATVACPNCGQTIMVPQMARVAAAAAPISRSAPAAKTQSPKRTKLWTAVAGIVIVTLLAGGFVTWQIERRATGPNLIRNGDFSRGNADFNSDYAYVPFDYADYTQTPRVVEGDYTVGTNIPPCYPPDWSPFQPVNGGGAQMLIANGGPNPSKSVWSQEVPVQPDTTYRISFYLAEISGAGNQADIAVCLDDDRVGDTIAPWKKNFWEPFSVLWHSGGNTSVLLSLKDLDTSAGGNDFAIADIRMAAVARGPESPDAKIKQAWSLPLRHAFYELRNDNDFDSANFVSKILDSLDQHKGLTPDALADDQERLNAQVRELVRRGAMESAVALQSVLSRAPLPPGPAGPANPNHKTGGKPGPGGLVLYLPFDKPDDNGIVHDESGAGNDGQVFGAQWVPDGKFGGAYQFHMTNLTDRIVIPNSDLLNPDYITISVWVKAADKDGFWNSLVDKDGQTAYNLSLGGDWNGKSWRGRPAFEIPKGFIGRGRPLDDNRWHHVAVTYDGTTMSSYVDGIKQSNRTKSGPLKKNDWDLCIGNSVVDYGTGEFLAFGGLIGEVRIYNRALSDDEIKSLAMAAHAGVDVISPEAQVKERRMNALNDALHDLQNANDQESATFVSNIIALLNQPGGQAPEALAVDQGRMKDRVRELVRSGEMESAAALNRGQVNAFWPDSPLQPPHPNHKTSGAPGPGGLVLYFPFDKPDENGVVHDESGAGNDGQVFGAQWVPDGKFGGAYRFDLTNFDDRIVIPNSDSLNPNYLTLAVWIKPASNPGFWRRIIDKDCGRGYCLSLAGSERIRGRPWFEGQVGIGADRMLDDDQWHHVAATYDGQMVRCYVDGVESGARRARSPGPLKGTTWDLCIGNSVPDYAGELLAFDGLIDEVRIYNRALSAEEIKTLATATNAGVDVIGAPAETEPKADTAERLRKVKELYDQGLITKKQYDQKVKEIMDSM